MGNGNDYMSGVHMVNIDKIWNGYLKIRTCNNSGEEKEISLNKKLPLIIVDYNKKDAEIRNKDNNSETETEIPSISLKFNIELLHKLCDNLIINSNGRKIQKETLPLNKTLSHHKVEKYLNYLLWNIEM